MARRFCRVFPRRGGIESIRKVLKGYSRSLAHLTHTRTHTLTHSHTHTLTHSHSHTHTLTHSHTRTLTQVLTPLDRAALFDTAFPPSEALANPDLAPKSIFDPQKKIGQVTRPCPTLNAILGYGLGFVRVQMLCQGA